ncbi:hypothetical protein FZZ91_00625 [Synechococcus sp. HB1133]|uniref:hypothetical protein n=1 Tax=unclassified Synechococcus TaxID=2626047 RepID=UPI00140B714D|nr:MULTISPECIES: hypothetical protein [unclassified Synechococcus]MCB4393861.1 hypothetical protein [Synechococcus sp. PH41509]MCB4421341.1 hypothetical protein [Synechococcus sp. HB1133]MCB4431308.1 hypothetical protein [Synechococcus sp. HBA1120]NHI80283.1 hypothetical protein [Synechococcus sp. HB1133]
MTLSLVRLLRHIQIYKAKSKYFSSLSDYEKALVNTIGTEAIGTVVQLFQLKQEKKVNLLSYRKDDPIRLFFLELAKIHLDGIEINNIYLKDYNEMQAKKSKGITGILCSYYIPSSTFYYESLKQKLGTTIPGSLLFKEYVYIDLVGLIAILRDCELPVTSTTIGVNKNLLRFNTSKLVSKGGNKIQVFALEKGSNRLCKFTALSEKKNELLEQIPLNLVRKGTIRLLIKNNTNNMIAGNYSTNRLVDCEIHPSDFNKNMIIAYKNKGGGGNELIDSIVESLKCRSEFADEYKSESEGVRLVWGVLRNSKAVIDDCIKNDLHFIYADHAYFKRGHKISYRISPNSFECNTYKLCDDKRRDLFNCRLEPWNQKGSKIIVCPPTDYFCEAHGTYGWLNSTLKQLRKYTDRKIVIRKKPTEGCESISLREQLQSAYALVTHSSNVAIESVCLGTPVFVSSASAASFVGQTNLAQIENPIYPDRENWVNNLSYCQFSYEEIRNGSFWNIFKHYHSLPDIT